MADALCLELASPSPAGAALHLRPGDRLCRVNGLPFTGAPEDLAARFAAAPRLALGFRRGEADFVVLAETAALGDWIAVPATALPDGARLHPEALCNWEVMAARDGCYDIQPLPASRAALLAAPLWLLQMRLWGLAAALMAAVALAFAVVPWLAVPVYLLAAIHVGSAGPAYVRADRRLRGMQPVAVLAARNEAGAHAAWRGLDGRARFLFARAPAAAAPVSA
ncbi:hypothetical protein LAZ29_18895 [Cereibacter sphaeroides]|uniref:hypothetical protein n=1 Tax=Cereibacter sphaeroides TaxID=1063 RepID=UPI001F23BD81|nr:hypothetical protein [Cereibacter sphaeroides]MCE6952998.1 hypothetical protein [Cereibacter sphaeroides]